MELIETLDEIIQKLSEEIQNDLHNGIAVTNDLLIKSVPV